VGEVGARVSTAERIVETVRRIEDLLLTKNRAYGDSALNPLRIFSRADPVEQLKVRIDDKLSRIARGDEHLESEDVVVDLIGYLILLLVARSSK
jgi:hypothetical protein